MPSFSQKLSGSDATLSDVSAEIICIESTFVYIKFRIECLYVCKQSPFEIEFNGKMLENIFMIQLLRNSHQNQSSIRRCHTSSKSLNCTRFADSVLAAAQEEPRAVVRAVLKMGAAEAVTRAA